MNIVEFNNINEEKAETIKCAFNYFLGTKHKLKLSGNMINLQ